MTTVRLAKLAAVCVSFAPLILGGCVSPSQADRAVRAAVEDKAARIEGISTNTVGDAFAGRQAPTAEPELRLDLAAALRAATRHSRQLQTRREDLYRSTLSLLATRRSFGVDVAGTASYVFQQPTEGDANSTYGVQARANRVVYTGGRVSLAGASTAATGSDTNGAEETTYDSSLTLRVEQPLLAGAGYTASHAALIQAERDLVYALRDFALDRQDFAVGVVRRFHELLLQQAVLENIRSNVQQSTLLRQRSEALFQVSRAPAIDLMRAQQQELSASNQLARAEADLDIQLRRFVLDLGLPAQGRLSLEGTIPEVTTAATDEDALVACALARRLDLKTARDRNADAERNLRVKQQALLPRMDVYGQGQLAGSDAESLGDQELEDDYTAGVTLELPLDRRDERDAARSAQLDLDASRRSLEETEDRVRLDVADNLRNLSYLKDSVLIEEQNVDLAGRRARNALLRFRNGELTNRDVVEAEEELLDARNARVRALASYEDERLRLLRNAGVLDVSAEGLLIELPLREE